MANSKFTLKRNNGSTFDELYPKTTTAQVDGLSGALDLKANLSSIGQANGIASLDANSKIPFSQLPSSVTGGMRFAGTVTLASGTDGSTAVELSTLFTELTYATHTTTGPSLVGSYKIVTVGGFVKNTTGTQNSVAFHRFDLGNNSSTTGLEYAEEGDDTSPFVLEKGDWIVYTGQRTISGNLYYLYAVVNNTYADATDTTKGVVTLVPAGVGDVQDINDYSEGVVTGGVLAAVVYSGDVFDVAAGNANKLALANHSHSNYQPLDSDLTTIAGLSSADGNFIVGSASGWVAESGTTVRTSLGLGDLATLNTVNNGDWSGTDLAVANGGTGASSASDARTNLGLTIGQNVQAYSAKLADIAGLAATNSNIIVGNGTTWVAESGATARTSLDVYSTSEVDDFFTNRPTIFYNTTTGSALGSLIIADVVAV